jgi:hypothetical protein
MEYPASPSESPYPLPSSPNPPKSLKPKGAKPNSGKHHKYEYRYPSSVIFSQSPESYPCPSLSHDEWSPQRNGGDHVRAYYGPPLRAYVDERHPRAGAREPDVYKYTFPQAHIEADSSDYESDTRRRMRIAREVDEQMREDENLLRQNQRMTRKEADEAHWESQLANGKKREHERETLREAEGADWRTWATDLARGRQDSSEAWESSQVTMKDIAMGTMEKVRGPGIQGLQYDGWDGVAIARAKAKLEKKHDMRYQRLEDFEEWKLEISDPAKGKSKSREEAMRRPRRWIEIRENPEGKVDIVMVRRRKPKE